MKAFFCIEYPYEGLGNRPSPAMSVAIAEISQFATRKLRELGVDPVRTVHLVGDRLQAVFETAEGPKEGPEWPVDGPGQGKQ